MSTNDYRRDAAFRIRVRAAEIARERHHPPHIANGDEYCYRRADGTPSLLASYTKGLPHCPTTGLVKSAEHFNQFVRAIDSGDPRDFRDTPLGHSHNRCSKHCAKHCNTGKLKHLWKSKKALTSGKDSGPVPIRAWESQGAGSTFDLEGPDAQAVTMPPAPALGSAELTAEMAEVYVQALLRDVPFTAMSFGTADEANRQRVKSFTDKLNKLPWFSGSSKLTAAEASRSRTNLTPETAFRGITPGDDVGPYLSQFLLVGNTGINARNRGRSAADGLITYGAITIDQRVRVATPSKDYMTCWDEWLDVQNGADLRGLEEYVGQNDRRFITTPRDLATYVHYDALYEAYLNACLIMLAAGVPFDPGIPFQLPDAQDHQQGFAHFGGPHILSLVTEVATRALKAVRFQKFNVHRRLRPEALAARLQKESDLGRAVRQLHRMYSDIDATGIFGEVIKHTKQQNVGSVEGKDGTLLLPMAFCEGSPMHPAYGAGHATVAGACVTILKAFFDHGHLIDFAGSPDKAFVPNATGSALVSVNVEQPSRADPTKGEPGVLTVEGELNKLASNISIGRDWAGVHYFTDYIESVRLGETIAIGLLQEQKITYGENFSMTVPLFDGDQVSV